MIPAARKKQGGSPTQQDKAVRLVRSSKAGVLARLSMKEKLALMEALVERQDGRCRAKLGEEATEQLSRLYAVTNLPEGFLLEDEMRLEEHCKALRQRKSFKEIKRSWARLSSHRRRHILSGLLKDYAETCGFPVPKLRLRKLDSTIQGLYANNVITIATQKGSRFGNFSEVVETLFHEATHAYQDHLISELAAGRIKRGTAKHDMARLMRVNMACAGMFDAEDSDYLLYKDQPMERHAWHMGRFARRRLISPLDRIPRLKPKAPRP